LENIKSCGEFVVPTVRKRSSAASNSVQNFKNEAEKDDAADAAEDFEFDTCYEKVML
jgi:hypothetical protein